MLCNIYGRMFIPVPNNAQSPTLFLCADSTAQPDKCLNGFRSVSPPLVLKKTFRYCNILLPPQGGAHTPG